MDEQLAHWDDLRTVLAIGRAGSLSGAARALRVSHPTVFRRINQIERRLGVRLFERKRAGYVLTLAGEELSAVAEGIEAQLTDAQRRLAGRDLRPSGTVRVTTTDTLIGLLTPILAAFRCAHPQIELDVIVSSEVLNISRRDADVAIRPSRQVPENLVGRRLAEIALAVYGHRGLGAQRRRTPALDGFPWVGPDETLSYLPLARWLRERGLHQRMVYRANTLLGCREAAAGGIGLAVLPCFLGDADPRLARIGAPIDELQSELWLLSHPDLRNVARLRVFLDFVARALAAHRGLLAGRATTAEMRRFTAAARRAS